MSDPQPRQLPRDGCAECAKLRALLEIKNELLAAYRMERPQLAARALAKLEKWREQYGKEG